MSTSNQIVAIVPARAGSRGVPGKNVRELAGHPLLAWSIAAGLAAERVDRVIVSTDGDGIAEIARRYGAEVPFRRPDELAGDRSPSLDYVRHMLKWMLEHEGAIPRLLVQLLPTTPLRDPTAIDDAVAKMLANDDAESLRSAHELAEPPQKMMGLEDGYLVGLFPDDPRPEYYNLPRQMFPPAFHPNGYVEIMRPAFVVGGGGLYGLKVLAQITHFAIEIDRAEDFEQAEYTVEKYGHPLLSRLDAAS